MLSTAHTTQSATVIQIAVPYFSACSIPYIREFPSINRDGEYSLHFGSNPIRYAASTTPPVPAITPVLESANVENNTISERVQTPNNHQQNTENNKLDAMELSQK